MLRTRLAPTPGSRQLAATILSWRIPKRWPSLSEQECDEVQAALLDCFSTCTEPPVLRSLGEACNSVCQAIATRHNVLWEGLLRLISSLLSGASTVHRHAALQLLASLADSMGARLHQFYGDIGQKLVEFMRDPDDSVRVAALGLIATVVSSWCLGQEDLQHWQAAAAATLEVAASTLSRPAGE